MDKHGNRRNCGDGSVEVLCRRSRHPGPDVGGNDSRIIAAYVRPWVSLFSAEDLHRAITAVPPVAVFIHAVAGGTWRTLDPLVNQSLAGYFRALTRRMYRDAVVEI